MLDGCETFRDCRTTIPLTALKFQLCAPFTVIFIDIQIQSNLPYPGRMGLKGVRKTEISVT